MKTINKKIVVPVILFVCLVVAVLCGYFLMPFWVYKPANASSIKVDKNQSMLSVSTNNIKILQLTDLHLNSKLDMPLSFSIIKKLVYKSNPDLIVITGDVFSSGCKETTVTQFINFMEDFKLPWATVLGNHDDETPLSLSNLSSKLESANYSLFKTGNLTNLYGNYNYNVEFANGNRFQLIFMDSRDDGFTQESVTYYESAINSAIILNNGNLVKNFLFYHIPINELNTAINYYKNDSNVGEGVLREEACTQITQVGFFDKVLELNATVAMIYGHDHINNARIKYQNIDFCYGAKSTTSAYDNKDLIGGVVYSVNSIGEYSAENIFVF